MYMYVWFYFCTLYMRYMYNVQLCPLNDKYPFKLIDIREEGVFEVAMDKFTFPLWCEKSELPNITYMYMFM